MSLVLITKSKDFYSLVWDLRKIHNKQTPMDKQIATSFHTARLIVFIFLFIALLPFHSFGDLKNDTDLSLQLISDINSKLTQEEKTWITEHPTLRVAGPKAFPPFYFHDENDKESGIASDYVQLILESLGISAEVQRNLPWPQVLEHAKNKQVDLITLAAKTDNREIYLDFSDAYLSFPLVIISKQDAPFIGGLSDLHNKKVACVKKNVTCEWLKNDVEFFQAVWVSSPLKALETVAYDKADVVIENLASASYQIQKYGLSNLKIAAPTVYGNYNLYFGVRKDWKILTSILNKSLALIKPEQHSTIRNRWLSIRYEHGIQQRDILKWVAIVTFTLMFPIVIVLIWNRKLKQEIIKRNEISQALRESENIFTTIFNNSPVPITISSLETDRYIDINKSVTDITGYTKEEMVGKTADELDIWLKPDLRKQMVDLVKNDGIVHHNEFLLKNKNGDIKSGLISGTKINLRNESCLLCVTMDISKRKEAEKKLRESQERYSALFERSLDPIMIYDVNGSMIDANPAALDILQVEKENITSMNFRDFVTREQYQEVLKQAGELVASGAQNGLKEYMLTRPDDSIAWLETTGSLIYENGTPVAIQGLGRDITQRKKAEKEQKHLISQLVDALDNIKSLKGMLPICANCKKIRDDSGYWNQIESYIEKHSDALFSHGICPECSDELYGNEAWYKKKQR